MKKYYLLYFEGRTKRVKVTYIDIANFCTYAHNLGLDASYEEAKDQTDY